MLQKIRNLIALSVVLMLLASMFVGCVQKQDTQNTSQTKQTEATSESETGVPDISSFKQTRPIRIMKDGIASIRPSDEEDIIKQEIEKRTGIKYVVEAYITNDYDTKLQLYIASDNLPDRFSTGDMNNVKMWANQGLIAPLDKMLENYGQNLLKSIDTESEFPRASVDGKVYAIPSEGTRLETGNVRDSHAIIVRKDWLDNLGLEIPETLDQLHEVAKAFTFNDPDKNSKNDTYGYAETRNALNAIKNAMGIGRGGNWILKDGKLVHESMTPEYVEAVKVGAQWYKEGILHPECLLITNKELKEKMSNSEIGISYGGVGYSNDDNAIGVAMTKKVPEADMIMIPCVSGPFGQGYYDEITAGSQVNVISAKAEHPELVIALMDFMAADRENAMLQDYGMKGVHYEISDKNELLYISPFEDQMEREKIGIGKYNDIYSVLDNKFYPQFRKEDMIRQAKFMRSVPFRDSVPAMQDYPELADPKEYLAEIEANVSVGELPAEELVKAQQRWYESGGNIITQQVNEAYQEMLKNSSK